MRSAKVKIRSEKGEHSVTLITNDGEELDLEGVTSVVVGFGVNQLASVKLDLIAFKIDVKDWGD